MDARIYGGKTVEIERYPYQISLEKNGRHNCGGSIISRHYVLTAAHCVDNYSPEILTVRSGSSFIHEGGKVHQVVRSIVHEDYKYTEYGVPLFDVAVVEVKEPFEFDESRKPVELFDNQEKVAPESKAVVTGWGLTEKSSFLPRQLQVVEIPVNSGEFCNDAYKSFDGMPMGQICAGENGLGVCSADSGGPLVYGGKQIGIVSWSSAVCAHPRFSGVYMEVASLRDWINFNAKL